MFYSLFTQDWTPHINTANCTSVILGGRPCQNLIQFWYYQNCIKLYQIISVSNSIKMGQFDTIKWYQIWVMHKFQLSPIWYVFKIWYNFDTIKTISNFKLCQVCSTKSHLIHFQNLILSKLYQISNCVKCIGNYLNSTKFPFAT